MKHQILIANLLLVSFVCFSQTTQKNSPGDFGFSVFKIKGRIDSISFIVSDTSFDQRKPVFLFCQGSLPYSLFYQEDSIHTWQQAIPFDYQKYLRDYNFVVISKPGIPVFSKTADKNFFYIDPKTKKVPQKYWVDNYLDYYVNSADDVINYLVKQKWVDKSKVVIAGVSQGSKVVSKLGAINKNITHVIYLAGNPLGRFDQNIRQNRRDALLGKITSEQAQKNIDSLYKLWNEMITKPNDVSSTNEDTYKTWVTFSQPLLPYLLKISVPLFVGYGTSDITSDYCDLLPLDFARLGKKNLTLKPYLDCDHNFLKVRFDKSGNEISREDMWDKLTEDFFNWLKMDK